MSQPSAVGAPTGLSAATAAERLEAEGPNELPTGGRRQLWAIAWEVVREPMFVLLMACGLLYLLMGEPRDALMLLGFVVVVMAITIVQERRTERALDALRELSSPRALVVRDGQRQRIAGREVVRGDWVVVAEGDRVPADGVLRTGTNVSADESLLTGESVAVRKRADRDAQALEAPGGDDLASLFSGTLVTSGQGLMEVLATGGRTKLGAIGGALATVETERTLLQQETARLVRALAIVAAVVCLAVVVGYALTRGGTPAAWAQGALRGLTLAMATIPEELPVVMTIFLALGAWRLSRRRVLTRRLPALEMLGAATVLCVDKTGTLTLNRMTVQRLQIGDQVLDLAAHDGQPLAEPWHELLEFAVLASRPEPFDPMETALRVAAQRLPADEQHLHPDWELIKEYPLTPELLALSHAWQADGSDPRRLAAKGAPEAIADLCHLEPAAGAALAKQVAALAGDGLRVLAVARADAPGDALPADQHELTWRLCGLVGFADPVRPGVPEAVARCRAAGLRVIMVTGDYPATALSIARQIGLDGLRDVLTGPEVEQLDEAALRRRVAEANVFARVVPQQKLRIVQALKANGEIVGMTGDGVNDAPALKAAHIGIAMGGRGTDVAREAAALVLLDDDFASIVDAVALGRRIFDNIRKAIAYIFAVHVPIAGLSIAPVLCADWPVLLLPVHVLFLELIIDPSCTLIFEAEEAEPGAMERPPRDPREPLFGLRTAVLSVSQGVGVLAALGGLFWAAGRLGHAGDDTRRALVFAALVVGNLALILTNRSWSRTILGMRNERNAALGWVLGGALVVLALVLAVGPLQRLFRFAPLHAPDLAWSAVAGVAGIVLFELRKVWLHWRRPQPAAA